MLAARHDDDNDDVSLNMWKKSYSVFIWSFWLARRKLLSRKSRKKGLKVFSIILLFIILNNGFCTVNKKEKAMTVLNNGCKRRSWSFTRANILQGSQTIDGPVQLLYPYYRPEMTTYMGKWNYQKNWTTIEEKRKKRMASWPLLWKTIANLTI